LPVVYLSSADVGAAARHSSAPRRIRVITVRRV